MQYRPGDIIKCQADHAPYPKWHLCVSDDGYYLYLNSPKAGKSWPGDYPISASEVPFIPPHHTGQSIISCRNVMKKTSFDLSTSNAVLEGKISTQLLTDLLIFVDGNPVLSPDDQAKILDGLGDWCGA